MVFDAQPATRRRRRTSPEHPGERTGRRPSPARRSGVLELLAQGQSTRAIAYAMYITEKTVRNHVEHIYTKLGVNRTLASLAAIARGPARLPIDPAVQRHNSQLAMLSASQKR